MTKIYISGPMTGYADFNRAEFDRIDEIYTSNGYEVVNPAR